VRRPVTLSRTERAQLVQPRCVPCGDASPCVEAGKCLRSGKLLAPARAKRQAPDAPPRGRSEHAEQVEVFRWAADMGATHPELLELFAVPNGARTATTVAKRLKAEGLKKGVEDVLLLVARGGWHGLCLELKRADGVPSDVKPAQREWHAIHTRRGYRVVVCFGAEEAKRVLLEYLTLPKTKVCAS
jgi:hypothetical protein